jgi:hypothetical protein
MNAFLEKERAEVKVTLKKVCLSLKFPTALRATLAVGTPRLTQMATLPQGTRTNSRTARRTSTRLSTLP